MTSSVPLGIGLAVLRFSLKVPNRFSPEFAGPNKARISRLNHSITSRVQQ